MQGQDIATGRGVYTQVRPCPPASPSRAQGSPIKGPQLTLQMRSQLRIQATLSCCAAKPRCPISFRSLQAGKQQQHTRARVVDRTSVVRGGQLAVGRPFV
jgi:hypothetical protein